MVLCEKYTPALLLVSVLSGRGESAVIAIDFVKGASNSLKTFQNQIGFGRGIFHGKIVLSSFDTRSSVVP